MTCDSSIAPARAAGGVISFLVSSAPALADLKLCNRMSYVVEVAIGIDDKAATATRGWFRIDPAACRVVAQGTLTADRILLNARALGVYGSSPIPQSGNDTLCIAPDNFVIAAARQCRAGQTPAPFTQINPTRTDDGHLVAYLAEGSEYDDEQARLAGIQRLLVIAGYDAAPIDGVDGPKTQAALAAFLKSRGLKRRCRAVAEFLHHHDRGGAVAVVHRADLVQRHAAQDHGRGRHRRRQDRDQPRLVSHRSRQMPASRRHRPAQADLQFCRSGRWREPHRSNIRDKPLNWGGTTQLCTRESKFEINEQGDCGTRGLAAIGFAAVDMSRRRQDAALCDAVMKFHVDLRKCHPNAMRPLTTGSSACCRSPMYRLRLGANVP